MSNAKKPRLPHGFRGMIAQVLVVIGRNDGRELFQCVFQILTEEDEWFFNNRGKALHVTFALPMTKGCDRLLGFSLQPHDGPYNGLRLFRKMVGFLLLLPLSRRFRTRPLGGLTLYFFFKAAYCLIKAILLPASISI